MDKRLPLGFSDFKNIIDDGYTYVDKTLLVQELLEKGVAVALIPRPRRFGKTLNLSMLRYFFEKTENDTSYLFHNLKVWKHEKSRAFQGQFRVIFITFKDIKHASWEDTLTHFRRLLAEEFQRHRYLLDGELLSIEEKNDFQLLLRKDGDKTLLETSLRLLIKWLHLYHGQQVILLIDEYDAPIHAAYIGNYYEQLIEFVRNLMSGCLKDSRHLKLGVLTGILRIAKESIFSGLNNVKAFTLLNDSFSDKFGLLECEVVDLLEEYNLAHSLPEMRKWFNGYQIGSCKGIYNPWSVLNCISEKGNLDTYWVNTSDNALMKQLITNSGEDLKVDLEELIKGGSVEKNVEEGIVFPDLKNSPNTVWSLLFFSGYLTSETSGKSTRLRIPNVEINTLFQTMIANWFERTIHSSKYHMLLDSLISGDIETFSQIFQEFLLRSISVFDINSEEPEKIYHAFVLGMLTGLKGRYEVKSNRESGYGRYDVMLIPKDPYELGIIMEFKKVGRFDKSDLETAAASALQQIEDKHYAEELVDRGLKRILYLALAFKGKSVLIKHKFI